MKSIAIIGAGLAGTILATKLSSRNRVYLLDIGDLKTSYPDFDKNSSELASVPTFSFGYGGTSNLWHNGLIDIKREHIVNECFSKLLSQIDKYTEESVSILTNGKVNLKDFNRVKKTPFDNVDTIIYPKERYLPRLNKNITFIGNVSDIDFVNHQGRVEYIKYLSTKGESLLKIDSIVISCGGLNSSHYVNKLLGKKENVTKLNDHPMGFVGKITVKDKFKKDFNIIALQQFKSFEAKQCFTVLDGKTGLRCALYLRNAFTKSHSLTISKHKSKLGASGGFLRQLINAFSFKTFHPDIILEIVNNVMNWNIKTRTFSLMFVGEQRELNLEVKKSSNHKKMDVQWGVSSDELNAYNRMLKKFIKDNTDFIESSSVIEISRDNLWSAAHYSGAVSIGNDIDSNLKVNGCENAYVCDASVISNHSYANTGLVISKLCCYLAEEVLV